MTDVIHLPAGNSKIEKAFDADGNVIGVNIILLVLPADFDSLPTMYRQAALHTYTAPPS